MTCIVGYTDGMYVYIGGDSAGLSGWELTARKDPKVFCVGEFVMGFTTSFRMGQILCHSFNPPEIPDGSDIYRYMTTEFVDEIRRVMREKGFAERHHEAEKGGQFLVGVRGRLFRVDSDFQVGETVHGFDAVGCGGSLAIGAMAAMLLEIMIWEVTPRDIIRKALQIAERFNGGVRGPFIIASTKDLT